MTHIVVEAEVNVGMREVADVFCVTERARGTGDIWKYYVEPVLCWENVMG